MPTTYTDQFWTIDPYAPPPAGTTLTVSFLDVVDQNNNNLINRFNNDRIDGSDITQSYPGDSVTVIDKDGNTVTVTGTTFYLADGRQVFTPTDGSTLTTSTLVNTSWSSSQGSMPVSNLGPPCFTPDTMIQTALGVRKVQDIRAGDLVMCQDKGLVRVRYVRRRLLSRAHLETYPNHAPVQIRAGALGPGVPSRDLTVSPQHRILIRSAIAERMFGVPEILVPACQLTAVPGVFQRAVDRPVRFIHLLLDHHGIVMADGAPTETLYLGHETRKMLSRAEIAKIEAVSATSNIWAMQPARLFVRGKRLKRLVDRHLANRKPLVDVPTAQSEASQTA